MRDAVEPCLHRHYCNIANQKQVVQPQLRFVEHNCPSGISMQKKILVARQAQKQELLKSPSRERKRWPVSASFLFGHQEFFNRLQFGVLPIEWGKRNISHPSRSLQVQELSSKTQTQTLTWMTSGLCNSVHSSIQFISVFLSRFTRTKKMNSSTGTHYQLIKVPTHAAIS